MKERVAGYVSDKDRYRWLGRVNENYGDLLRNKWFFHQFFGHREIPTPTYYGNYHHRRGRWIDGSRLCSGEDILAALDNSAVDALVIKPVVGSGGNKVMIFSDIIGGKLIDSSGRAWTAGELADALGKGDYIFEEWVEQHAELSALYPHSLNTVRITTLNDGEQALPWAAVLRVGTAKSGSVDNWGRGGLSVALDVQSGELGCGVVSVKHLAGLPESTTEHPDTGCEFAGRVLPNWQTVLDTVSRVAALVPGLPYIAWDVAITEDGCRIIEGNHRPDVNLLQVHGGLLTADKHVHWWQEHLPR